jgi:hypothetical protein
VDRQFPSRGSKALPASDRQTLLVGIRRDSVIFGTAMTEKPEVDGSPSQQETQNPGVAGACESLRYCTNDHVGGKGLEPSTSTV